MQDAVVAPAASEVDLRVISESIPHIVFLAGTNGASPFLNQRGADYVGVAAATQDWDWLSTIHPDDVDAARLGWQHAVRTETEYFLEMRIRRFDGEYRWHAVRGLPMRDEQGRCRRWLGTATDIEDVTRSEVDLRLANRTIAETLTVLETLQLQAPVGFAFIDRNFRVVRVNKRLAAAYGSTVDTYVGALMADAIPEVWPRMEPLFRHVLDKREAVLDIEVDDFLLTADGSRMGNWLMSVYPVSVATEVIGLGVVVIDVTERKQTEGDRRQLAAIVAGSGDAIFAVTNDGLIATWNAAAVRLYGYTREEIIDQSISILAPEELFAEQDGVRARLLAGGPSEHFETTRRHKDGTAIEVLISASSITSDAGDVVAMSVIADDIGERARSAAAQRAVEARYEIGFEQAAVGIAIADLKGVPTRVNPALCALLGRRAEVLLAGEMAAFTHPDDVPLRQMVLASMTTGHDHYEDERRYRAP